MWAEAWALYRAGEQWWPDEELQRQLNAQAPEYAEEFPLGDKVIEVFGPLTPAEKAKRGVIGLTAFDVLRAVVSHLPNPGDQRDVNAARDLGNWLAVNNLDEWGGPDRFKSEGARKWRMPNPKPKPRRRKF